MNRGVFSSRSGRMHASACRRLFVVAIASGLAASLVSSPVRAVEPEKLEIVTTSGPLAFSVEVMRTDADRAQGLMFRRYMPQDRGMLFDFEHEAPVMMWMKNTILPLDMVFIGHDGHIVNIAENAEPMSETTIPSAGPVSGVLELNAGTAARLGLKKGDIVHHRMFAN